MNTLPLRVSCPACGSSNVAYSCEPECCFNHVCEDCLNSFQLATRDLGIHAAALTNGLPDPDSCAPTAACASCHSLRVRSIEGEEASAVKAVCVDCGAMLELAFE